MIPFTVKSMNKPQQEEVPVEFVHLLFKLADRDEN